MTAPRVIADLVHQLADLHAWGRHEGQWWALISWGVHGILDEGHNGDIRCTAWVPAAGVTPSADQSQRALYRGVARLELPTDRTAWPAPISARSVRQHDYGPITAPPTETPGTRDPHPDRTASHIRTAVTAHRCGHRYWNDARGPSTARAAISIRCPTTKELERHVMHAVRGISGRWSSGVFMYRYAVAHPA